MLITKQQSWYFFGFQDFPQARGVPPTLPPPPQNAPLAEPVHRSRQVKLSFNLGKHVLSSKTGYDQFQDYTVCYVIVTKCPTTPGVGPTST